MAPPLSVLQRGEVLQYTKWAIIAFAIGFLCLFSFCTAIFLFMMRKQRTRRQAQLDVQSERRPFVTPLAQTDQSPSPKLPQYVRSPPPSYAYNEGIELQGTTNIAKIREQVQRQQLEGRQLPVRSTIARSMDIKKFKWLANLL